jgi:vancomycin resistance protein YoaR
LAWSVGRQGNFGRIVAEQIRAIFGSNRKQAVFSYNDELLNQKIKTLAEKVDQPEKDANIKIKDLVLTVEAEEIGKRLDQSQAKKLILDSIGNLMTPDKIELVIKEVLPKVAASEAAKALEQTNKILSNSLNVEVKSKNYKIEPKDVTSWLEFVPEQELITQNWVLSVNVKKDSVQKFISTVANEVNQPAKDAKFAINNGKIETFQLSQIGYELNQEEAIKTVSEAIMSTQNKVTLLVKETKPEVSDLSDAGSIKELVAEGVTSWKGSPANRIHNLTLGAKNISGIIVKPGEEFSTIKALGPIDLEHGFKKELVIKNSTEVSPEVGGGLCQVSTTLFRAAMNAGLKITARSNHSFRVSYYEPPVGMDATIYDPKPDFKFVNNMKTPILIWAVPTDTNLSFQIYGTKDGRVSEISVPVLFGYVNPGDKVYRETDTMATGAIRLVERATRGVTASFTYKVTTASGEILEDDKFVSKYVPVPETYLIGPGTQIPTP